MPVKYLSTVKRTEVVTKNHKGKTMGQIAREMEISKNTALILCSQAQYGEAETALKQKNGLEQLGKLQRRLINCSNGWLSNSFHLLAKK